MVSYKRQGGSGFFDFRKNDMAMDVSWCTLIPLLSPTKEIMKTFINAKKSPDAW